MLHDVLEVRPLRDYQLWLRFDDGAEGVVDVSQLVRFEGVFEPLKEPSLFAQVTVCPDAGTICWPNGADLDPVALYARATGTEIPDYSHLSRQT